MQVKFKLLSIQKYTEHALNKNAECFSLHNQCLQSFKKHTHTHKHQNKHLKQLKYNSREQMTHPSSRLSSLSLREGMLPLPGPLTEDSGGVSDDPLTSWPFVRLVGTGAGEDCCMGVMTSFFTWSTQSSINLLHRASDCDKNKEPTIHYSDKSASSQQNGKK